MKVNESYDIHGIFFIKSLTFVPFHSIAMYFVDFFFRFSKYDHRISVLPRQFQNFELLYLAIVKVKNSSIADTYRQVVKRYTKTN